VQLLVPEASLAYVYSVKPAEFTSIVLPRVALLEVRTVALALAAGLVAAVLALGVAVAAGVVDEACVADAAVRAGVGVVVELLLPPQAALIDRPVSRPVDARNGVKRLFIGLLSVLDGQSLRTYVSRQQSDAAQAAMPSRSVPLRYFRLPRQPGPEKKHDQQRGQDDRQNVLVASRNQSRQYVERNHAWPGAAR
jgi:hypothetical protein